MPLRQRNILIISLLKIICPKRDTGFSKRKVYSINWIYLYYWEVMKVSGIKHEFFPNSNYFNQKQFIKSHMALGLNRFLCSMR